MPTLYAVYGERNLNANIISHANVGYTSKTVEERCDRKQGSSLVGRILCAH
jgi:hypothetical protein